MAIVLGDNQYGKAETRVVRVVRDGERHTLRDCNVSVALAGDLAAAHLRGDNAAVLPTDTMKNTVYAFAKEHGIASPEVFGLLLARHFVGSQPTIHRSRVSVTEYGWQRLGPHSFARDGSEERTAVVTADGTATTVVSGLSGLVLLNTTDSAFTGYVKDRYTTLPETDDRVLATAVDARWRYRDADHADLTDGAGFAAARDAVRQAMVEAFTGTYSHSLQQTLYAMGEAALAACEQAVEIRLSLPNKHHLLVDLAPFGLANDGEVFVAADRPYGLIEGTVLRDDAPAPGLAWW